MSAEREHVESPAAVAAGQGETLSPVQTELQRALKTLFVAMRRLRGRETHQHDQISYAQHGMLHALHGHQPMTCRELAEGALLSPGTVTQMLETLEQSGLVERQRSEIDKRKQMVALTARGEALMAERNATVERHFLAAVQGLNDEQIKTATMVLTRMASTFDRR